MAAEAGGLYGGGAGTSGENANGTGGGGGSGYINMSFLTNGQTIVGNQQFLSPTGINETGHTGNGYARITIID